MNSYRDLLVWQKSMILVKHVYRTTLRFPREELYGLTSQMRQAAVSIPSNIAEGCGRHESKEFLRFLRIAIASLFELQTQSEIAHDLAYISIDVCRDTNGLTGELERMLASRIRKLRIRLSSERK